VPSHLNMDNASLILQTLDEHLEHAMRLVLPENLATAICEVRPFGVDACRGVQENGQLNEMRLARFVERVHSFTRI
jgi:hypothetical protein